MRALRIEAVAVAVGVLAFGACGNAPSSGGAPPAPTQESTAHQALARVQSLVRADGAVSRRLANTRDGFSEVAGGFASITAREPRASIVPTLSTRIGRYADEAWELAPSGDAPSALRLIPEANAHVPATLDAGRAIYQNVRPSTDAVFVSDALSSELLYILHGPAAPHRFDFRIERAAGSSLHPRIEEDGGISFVDAAGALRLTVAPAFAIDAVGTRRKASLSTEGDLLRVSVDTSGLTYPIVLDPYVGTARWTRVLVDPPARGDATMTSLGSNVLLIGGSAASAFDDTWLFDGTAWVKSTSTSSPLPLGAYSVASLGSKAILFGGLDPAGTLHNDTWSFDGTTWTMLSPTHKPPARRWAAMTNVGYKIVLYGGVDLTGARTDTWTFDGTDWTQASPATTPPATATLRMASASSTTAMLLAQRGTSWTWWLWDGTNWTDKTTAAPAAFFSPYPVNAGGTLHVLDLDTPGGALMWDWTGSSWGTRGLTTAPPTRRVPALASFGSTFVLFGGFTGSGFAALGDLWKWDGANDFVQVIPQSAPPSRQFVSGASLDDKFVIFGGHDPSNIFDDTWEWNGSRWTQMHPAQKPGARFSAAFGNAGSVALLAGGDWGGSNDVWTWDHTNWKPVGTLPSAATLKSGALVRIGAGDVMVETGGQPWSGAYAWDGTAFSVLSVPSPPHDSGLFGSFGDHGIFVDLAFGEQWTYTSAGFARDTTANSVDLPWNGRDVTGSAVDGTFSVEWGRFLFSMIDLVKGAYGLHNEAWIWDGTRWSELALTGLPVRTAYALGKQGSSLVLYGGADDAFVESSDTYVLSFALAGGTSCKSDSECETGHCSDGVCCNRACAGTCEACDLLGTAGTCTPVVGAPKHGSCPAPGADPCSQSICDGKAGAKCAGFVGGAVSCRTAACTSGADVAAASCNGSGVCPAAVTHKCSPFACGATSCNDACRVDKDCDTGFHCEPATGKCQSGAVCSDDRTLLGSDGTKVDCSPYRCGAGACVTACASSDDCLGGYYCDVGAKTCNAASAKGAGGCAVSGPGAGEGGLVAVLGGLLIAAAAMRRRAAGEASV